MYDLCMTHDPKCMTHFRKNAGIGILNLKKANTYTKPIISYYYMSTMIDRLVVAFIHGRKEKVRGNDYGRIEMRLTLQRRQKYISTGFRCGWDEWDGQRVCNRPDSMEINNLLSDLMRRLREIEQDLRARSMLSLDNIQARLEQRSETGSMELEKYFSERIEVRSYGKGRTTGLRYRRAVEALTHACRVRWLDDFGELQVVKLDKSLKSAGLSEETRWYNYHRHLRALMSDAVKDGLARRNPYDGGVVHRPNDRYGRALERCLTMDELQRVISSDVGNGYLARARDLFVFQCYTCMGYSDLREFDKRRIQEIEGRKVYSSRRHKTGEKFTFLLLAEAESILHKYEWKLPVLSNQKYNTYLKAVAAIAGVDKPISSHWARHTGATILLNAGVPMDVVARILGHSSSEITRKVYAKLLDETVAREMMRVEKELGK